MTKIVTLILSLTIFLCASLTTGCFFGDKEDAKDTKPAAATEVKQKSEDAKPAEAEQPQAKQEAKDSAPTPAIAPTSEPKAEAKSEKQAEHNYSVLIKKSQFKVYLLDKGEVVKSYGCALGKNPGQKEKSGDMKTPTGTFIIEEIIDSSWWTHDFKDGKGEIKGAYGPWFLSLDTTQLSKGQWDGIGIHGTHDPASIGTRASEGCIRLLNEDIDDLKRHVQVGTRVTIEE